MTAAAQIAATVTTAASDRRPGVRNRYPAPSASWARSRANADPVEVSSARTGRTFGNLSTKYAATTKLSASSAKHAAGSHQNSRLAASGPARSMPTVSAVTNRPLASSRSSGPASSTSRIWDAESAKVSALVSRNAQAHSSGTPAWPVKIATASKPVTTARTACATAITRLGDHRSTYTPAGRATTSQGRTIATAMADAASGLPVLIAV